MHAFCPACGAPCEQRVPEGDDKLRSVCSACGLVHYLNPRVVVASVATWGERVLLIRRAIDPRRGYWALPAGFLEVGETTREGAVREAREEAGVALEITGLLAVYELTHVQQVQLVYAARLPGPELAPGVESLEARLFREEEVPWAELAFPTVGWALRYHFGLAGQEPYAPQRNPSDERLGE